MRWGVLWTDACFSHTHLCLPTPDMFPACFHRKRRRHRTDSDLGDLRGLQLPCDSCDLLQSALRTSINYPGICKPLYSPPFWRCCVIIRAEACGSSKGPAFTCRESTLPMTVWEVPFQRYLLGLSGGLSASARFVLLEMP